ncbi:MAG: hypothetical protein H6555_05365 [Lewinellaceae bacterium]|nr:hypothetical protein [Lewinellaceae bacterium]
MARNFYFLFLLILFAGGCSNVSFSDTTEVTPRPFVQFEARVGSDFPGIARMVNQSAGMVRYEWAFGYLTPEGKIAGSTLANPIVLFPANGSYTVELTGIAQDSSRQSLQQRITISSHP